MRIPALIIGLLVFGTSADLATADWLNPTSQADCRNGQQEVFEQRMAAQGRERQCHTNHSAAYWAGQVKYRTFLCGILPKHQGVYTLEPCAQHAQVICDLKLEANRRRDICERRLADHRARQAALQAQRSGVGSTMDQLAARYVQENYQSLPDGPGTLSGDIQASGERMAELFGVQMTGDRGAYTLSTAVTQVGNEIIGRLNERALGELEQGLRVFDASNPRPTTAQRDAFHAQQAALASQYAAHATRLRNTDHTLPIGDESAVIGTYAGVIVQLVRMRNSGEIDEPIAVLGAAAATLLAVSAYRTAEERAQAQSDPATPRALPTDQLRRMRQEALTAVRQARRAAAVTATPRPTPTPSAQSARTAQACLRLVSTDARYGQLMNWYTSTCSRPVYCRVLSGPHSGGLVALPRNGAVSGMPTGSVLGQCTYSP